MILLKNMNQKLKDICVYAKERKITMEVQKRNDLEDKIRYIEEYLEDLKAELNTYSEQESSIEQKSNVEQEDKTPKYGEEYYFVNLDNYDICQSIWTKTLEDVIRYENNVIFEDYNEASKYIDFLLEIRDNKDNFTKEEWKDFNIEKYGIYYDCTGKSFNYYIVHANKIIGLIYFKTCEDYEKFVTKYETQLKRYLNIEED